MIQAAAQVETSKLQSFTRQQFQSVTTGSQSGRVEAVRQRLGYSVAQRDQESRFWFLRPERSRSDLRETQRWLSELSELPHTKLI